MIMIQMPLTLTSLFCSTFNRTAVIWNIDFQFI